MFLNLLKINKSCISLKRKKRNEKTPKRRNKNLSKAILFNSRKRAIYDALLFIVYLVFFYFFFISMNIRIRKEKEQFNFRQIKLQFKKFFQMRKNY